MAPSHSISSSTASQSQKQTQPLAAHVSAIRQSTRRSGSQRLGNQNVGQNERWVSAAAGTIIAAMGLGRRDLTGLLIAGLGGAMIYRGATGHCPAYEKLGMDTSDGEEGSRGTTVRQSFVIDKPAEELYAFWRDFENLPQFMQHLISVTKLDDQRSHWVAKAPKLIGGKVEWDAEITADRPNEEIVWRSLPGSSIDHQGSIRFEAAPGKRGTLVHVHLQYLPPGGALGRWVAKLFGEEPEQQIRDDLRNFKRLMEVGEIPSTEGQPRGTCTGRGRREG